MRQLIILVLFLGIIVSGCVQNPLKQVPVVKANITFVEEQGKFIAKNYTLTQGTVDYAGRPRTTRAESFPAITGGTLVIKNNTKNDTMETLSPWENLPFKGNGTYIFNIGFNEKYYPETNDIVFISIIVTDKNGKRIGYLKENKKWE